MLRPLLDLLSPGGSRGRLSILIFHRVLPEVDPLFPDEMEAARFDQLCGWLRDGFNVLPLAEAATMRRNGRLPARALAITFDDGYADNRTVAMPILQRHGLPATFFIATGFLDGGRMWNDGLIEAVRRSPLPEVDFAAAGVAQVGRRVLGDTAAKRSTIDALIGALKYLPVPERLQRVQAVAEVCAARLPDDLMMRSEQVLEMHRGGMAIGAHTVNHPILATLTREQAREEIAASRDRLQAITGAPVTLFAYPNGKPTQDYDAQAVDVVRELGFETAVSTAWGAAHAGSSTLELPRFTPWDRGRMAFGLRLSRNLWASRASNDAIGTPA